jgi:hypothetical protein
MTKTLSRMLILVLIASLIYFGTIGRDDFYRLLDAVQDIIEVIAANYLRK